MYDTLLTSKRSTTFTSLVAHRSRTPRCDKNFLLYFALVQVRRHLPGIRRDAATRFPGVPFEKIALYARLLLWPMTVEMYPLENGRYGHHALKQDTRVAMHFRTLALQRVERNDSGATMLSLHYQDGHDWSTKFFVIRLDKAHVVQAEERWRSKRPSTVDANGASLEAIPDDVDEIIDIIERTAHRLRSSIWAPGLIEGCVDDYFKKA